MAEAAISISHSFALEPKPEAEAKRAAPRSWTEVWFTSQDGLNLYARDYAQTEGPEAFPILCLPGLSRNSKDFHDLAVRLGPRRRVIAADYRGRGHSDRSDDWTTYSPLREMQDAVDLLTVLGVHEVIVAGTSRGALIAMLMAVFRPGAVRAAILNDAGPEIEPRGLLRIKGYLGQHRDPVDWNDAVYLLQQTNRGFSRLSDEDWHAWARRTYRTENGLPKADFDPDLNRTFASHTEITEGKLPTLWPQFNALKRRPVLLVRGEHSDILTPEIVKKMLAVKPDMSTVTVKDRGHAPFLDEPEAVKAIDEFLLFVGGPETV